MRVLARTPRWRPFAEFVARWLRRPLRDGDGASAKSIAAAARRLGSMPEALREWFELCGGRPDIHNREGILGCVPLAQLVASDNERFDEPLVALIDECQGAGFYGLRGSSLSSTDPPAVACTEGPLHELGEPLSRFLHHITIHRGFTGGGEVTFQGEYGGQGEAIGEGARALAAIEAQWPRLPFPIIGWGDPPDSGFHLFGDGDLLIEWDTTWHVQVCARGPDALATFRERMTGLVAFFD